MIDVTAKNGEQFQINEALIIAGKPRPSGDTDLFLEQQVPKPNNPDRLVKRLRVTESVDDLWDLELKKYETLGEGAYWYLNEGKILSAIETGEGVQVYLASKVLDGKTSFTTRRLRLREVD